MNNENALERLSLFGGLDESIIDEAREQPAVRQRKRFGKKTVFILVAAAVILSASAVGASAVIKGYISHKENAAHELTNSGLVSELEDRAGEPIVCENSHMRLTVDMIMSDEDYIHCTATLEGLDAEGKKLISDKLTLFEEIQGMTSDETMKYLVSKDGSYSFIPYMEVHALSGEIIKVGHGSGADLMYGKKGDDAEAAFSFGFERSTLNGEKAVRIECRQPETFFTESPAAGIFEGMSFELPTETNLDTLILRSEDGAKEMHLSEVSVYPVDYTYHRTTDPIITVYYNDGTVLENVRDLSVTEQSLYDLAKVERVELDGVKYYPKEMIKADTKSHN